MLIPQVAPWLEEAEQAAVLETIANNWITEGPRAAEFSAQLNGLIGTPYGVFAPNGTLALALGLLALGIGPGDEVLVPDTTFIASANAVCMVGATPVFADVTPETYQIDVAACARHLSERTRAIMPVHLYGMAANMRAVMDFARAHSLLVIEDAAQAIGVHYQGQHAGSFGDVGCFSFFADKTITTGEGGYVACHSPAIYERLRLLRNQGRLDRGSFVHPALGYNFRITDMQAALGVAQLQKLDQIVERKRRIYRWYQDRLSEVEQVRFLPVEPGSELVPFRVVLLCEDVRQLMQYAERHAIQARSFFYPLHQQPCFRHLDRRHGGGYDLDDRQYPHAIDGYARGVLLPVFPTLTEQQIEYICTTIRSFYAEKVCVRALSSTNSST